jgi:hypothetical protein
MTSNPFSFSPSDLRKTPRTIFRRPAVLHVSATQSISVKTVDISQEGICVLADLSLTAGHMCGIEFNASFDQQPQPLRLDGRVAYCVLSGPAGFRIGFHLQNLNPAAKKHIEKIMSMQKF